MLKSSKYPVNSKIDTLNISAIQSLDTKIDQVLGRVPQVMHYVFNFEKKTWDNSDIKGALFIYERTSSPKYAFIILNTQNMGKDLKVFVKPEMQFQLYYPLLMYRSVDCGICALYIYNKPDFYKTGELFSNLVSQIHPGGVQHETVTMPEHNIIASSVLESQQHQPFTMYGSGGAGGSRGAGGSGGAGGAGGTAYNGASSQHFNEAYSAANTSRSSCRIQNLDASLLSSPQMLSWLCYDKDKEDIRDAERREEFNVGGGGDGGDDVDDESIEPKGVDIMAMLSKAQTEYETKLNKPDESEMLNQYVYKPKKSSKKKVKSDNFIDNEFADNIQKKFNIFENIPDTQASIRSSSKKSKRKSKTSESSQTNMKNRDPGGESLTGSSSKTLLSPDMFESSENDSSTERTSVQVKPLSRTQLQQTLINLISDDDEFVDKIHAAYMKFTSKKN